MTVRQLTADEVTFTVTVEPDDTPFHGNAIASGDDAADKAYEDWIQRELDRGNTYAWCVVVVSAQWRSYEADDLLGGVCVASHADLERDIAPDMRACALGALNDVIAAAERDVRDLQL